MSKSVHARRLHIHLPRHLDEETYRERWESGLEPDASPYGFHHARTLGYSVTFSKPHEYRSYLHRKLFGVLNRAAMGIDIGHAWHNREMLRKADVVWTMLEQEGLAVSMLIRLGVIRSVPVIGGTVWLINTWQSISTSRRAAYRRILAGWAAMTVATKACLDIARSKMPEVNTRLLHFGISANTFLPLPHRPRDRDHIAIFAMGNDRTRDWDVLFRAFGNDDRFRINLVCRWVGDEVMLKYHNVYLIREPSIAQMRELYAEADYAAVTMYENVFSGITVALEAAALGVPILGTRTGGLATYFSEEEMLLADVGDDDGLKHAVLGQSPAERQAMADRAQGKFRDSDYTTLGMIKRYDALTRSTMHDG